MWCVSHYLSEIAYLHIYKLNNEAPEVCFEIKRMAAGIEGEDAIRPIIGVKFGQTHDRPARSSCAVLCVLKTSFQMFPGRSSTEAKG